MEISDFETFKSSEQALDRYFTLWEKLSSAEKLVPCLVVKQSDIESSRLVGLTEALKLLERYTKLSKIFIIVSHSEPSLTLKAVKDKIRDN